MDSSSSFEGFVFDPSKCNKLSMEEKRELVYELSKWSHGAPEMLQSWSRQEILQILCAEMGKERKYTGLTKLKIIENLLKVVSENKLQKHGTLTDLERQPSAEVGQRTFKRQRKTDHPNRLPVEAKNSLVNNVNGDFGSVIYCKNSACRAKLSREDVFCKRCSCCICYKYDDNKDPSLWLICSSEPPFQGDSCGMSCHLECALRHERSGIRKDRQDKGLDGCFYCVSCGKVNDLLGCWRKQLVVARDTRRVDILCYRVSLSQKILSGTKSYQNLYRIAEAAAKKLEADAGPLTGLPMKMARGIVNRLSSGPEVQRLCGFALDSLDSMLSDRVLNVSSDTMIQDCNVMAPNIIRFEDARASALTLILGSEDPSMDDSVSYTVWHRNADDMDYPAEPTCRLLAPNTKFLLSDLTPATTYLFKVVCFDGQRELGTCEVLSRTCSSGDKAINPNAKSLVDERSQSPPTNCSRLSNPSSVEDETNNAVPDSNENENRENSYPAFCKNGDKNVSGNVTSGTNTGNRRNQGDSVSILDEEHTLGKNNSPQISDAINRDKKHSSNGQAIVKMSTDNESNIPVQTCMACVPFVDSSEPGLPITPCKLENTKNGLVRNGRPNQRKKDTDDGYGKEQEPQAGSSSKERSGGRRDEECAGIVEKDFEYYVKVIRWLECEGHIETTFRQKFLTWYSLRATPQEVRVVKVFVDTLIEDPGSLAGQLVDSFTEVLSSKRSGSLVPAGFCLKLWH